MAAVWVPDVVFLDLVMPGMDGLKVAELLRAQRGPKELTLVALTGDTTDASRRRAGEFGFSHFLLKPSDPHTLKQLLSALARTHGVLGPATMLRAE